MEVYTAKFDYDKEREDILSFKKGDMFQITSKADKKWWAAYAVESKEYGYIPSKYVEPFIDPLEGERAQKLVESNFGDTKKEALAELMRTVPKKKASSRSRKQDSDDEGLDSDEGESGITIIRPLTEVSRIPDDCEQIEPKRLPNPHKDSKQHVRLNKEIKLANARGGVAQNLGRPELQQVMQRRKADADGNLGSIKPDRGVKVKSSSGGNELEKQLARRTQLLDEAEKEVVEEQSKPEFLKVSLRKAQQC